MSNVRYRDVAPGPNMVRIYMEVDLQNKELPTGRWGYTADELAEACGVERNRVESLMSNCRRLHCRCKYVSVWIPDDFPLKLRSKAMRKYKFPVFKCYNCPHYDPGCAENSFTRQCNGFKGNKSRRFRAKDPAYKAPSWCPRRLDKPVCRIYDFADEMSEFFELMRVREFDRNAEYAHPTPSHYKLRSEHTLGLTAKHFYEAVGKSSLKQVLNNIDFGIGNVIELDDGLKPYYFFVLGSEIVMCSQFYREKTK